MTARERKARFKRFLFAVAASLPSDIDPPDDAWDAAGNQRPEWEIAVEEFERECRRRATPSEATPTS